MKGKEVILVIVLFLVLGGISFIKYRRAKEEIIEKKLIFNMYALKTELESFKRDSGFYPRDLSQVPHIDTLVNPVSGVVGPGEAIDVLIEVPDSGKPGLVLYVPEIRNDTVISYKIIGFNRRGKRISLEAGASNQPTP
jgi:type II secretory pathway pseudopilin PulG